MPLVELNLRPSPKRVRTFGAVGMPLSFAVGALVAWMRFDSITVAGILGLAAVVVEAATWIAPPLVRSLMVAVQVVTFPLSWAISHLTLALLFFGVLTPLAWIVRAVHGDPLARERDATLSSYWVPRRSAPIERYFREY